MLKEWHSLLLFSLTQIKHADQQARTLGAAGAAVQTLPAGRRSKAGLVHTKCGFFIKRLQLIYSLLMFADAAAPTGEAFVGHKPLSKRYKGQLKVNAG
jgi:hypothetical protein